MKSMIYQIPAGKQIHQGLKKGRRYIQMRRYENFFASEGYSFFRGVFETFEQAVQSAPKTKSIGYNNPELAQEYRWMLENNSWEGSQRSIASYDYPVLFWLNLIFSQGCKTIFDFGGNVGIHFYSYSKYLTYPNGLQWTVCDLPEIIKVGAEIAEKRCTQEIHFTDDFQAVNGQTIMLASGSVQYVDNFIEQLASVQRPRHLLINRLPLHEKIQFVTLQNGGKVFYPQYVFQKSQFIQSLNNIGYKLVDIWDDLVDSCNIPFYPETSLSSYKGLYLKLQD